MSKIVYIDNLYDIVNKCNNAHHITIKMKVADVKPSTHVDSTKEINDKDPKFKTGDVIRISKYKIIFAKDYVSNLSEENFMIKKVKNNMPWTYLVSDLKGEEIVWALYKKILQKNKSKRV